MHSYDSSASPLGRLIAESLSGRLSRREIMRRGAALGLSAPVIAMVLSAGTRGAAAQEPPAVAPGSTVEVPQGLRTDLGGTTISAVLTAASNPDRPWQEAVNAIFTTATGINVTFVPGEQSATDRLANYNQQLGAQSTDNDVFQIDVIWPGIMAQHAVDLSEALSDLAAQQLPTIVENNTVDGALVSMPWYTDAGLLYYRTDLLEKYGIENPPTTWAELQEQAMAIQEGERAANPAFYGFSFQGKAYEGLTCNALEWQVSHGAGPIIDEDGTVVVNVPEAVAAFERARGWVGTIAPEDVTTFEEPDALNVFAPGNAAFMRNWPYAFAVTQAEGSPLIGKVDVVPLPAGDGPNARNAACLGGWNMMVSKYSQNQEAALEYVKFMCSPGVQKSFAIERSHSPTAVSVYDDPDVAAAQPFIAGLKEVFTGGAVARPSTVSADLYNSVSIAYHTGVNSILSGSTEPAAGAESIQSELEDVMSDLG